MMHGANMKISYNSVTLWALMGYSRLNFIFTLTFTTVH